MQTYIVLLRAVNVSGKNIIKMAELKAHLQKHFNNVQTYIQSGNIILHSDREKQAVQSQLTTLIKQYFELDIAVFVLTANELSLIIKNNPFDIDLASNNVYITLLDHKPDEEITRQFDELDWVMRNMRFKVRCSTFISLKEWPTLNSLTHLSRKN